MALQKILVEDFENLLNSDLDFSNFNSKTILVAGANGFLASYFVELVLFANKVNNLNAKVIALVRDISKAKQRFSSYLNCKHLVLLNQDVCSKFSISCDIDYVIHYASAASPKVYGINPISVQNANLLGTINLLELSKEKRVKSFLYISSGEIYGSVDFKKMPITENTFGFLDHTLVRSCYGQSKRMAENICFCWYFQHNLPIKIARPFHTYGPGMDLSDGRVFSDFVSDVINTRDIIMKSDGKDHRAFCYVSDVTSGFLRILFDGENGNAYNVGSDIETSIEELGKILISLFPEKKLSLKMQLGTDRGTYLNSNIRRGYPSVEKLRNLGWDFKMSVAEGFRRTVLFYLFND
jgi:UDP-glucuronate decarboxylase